MVGAIYVYVDIVFCFHVFVFCCFVGFFFFWGGGGEGGGGVFFLNCSVGCFSMTVWTPAVLSVLYACIQYFVFLYLPLFSATEHVSHGKAL